MSSYKDFTINSKNPLARFSHRTRNKVAVSMIEGTDNIRLLDFACGDGEFLINASLSKKNNIYIGFEPYMESQNEAKDISICSNWSEIELYCESNGLFDFVTCFETMEHFSEERQNEILKDIKGTLKSNGKLIISVPIEKGFPVLPKNLRRLATDYKGSEEVLTFKNILYSLFGFKSSFVRQLRTGDEYIPYHMGFFFTDFEKVLRNHFLVESKSFSPFPMLPYFFNSQVFYKLSLLKTEKSSID